MNVSKPYILIAVVILIIGMIYPINSRSVKRVGSDRAVTVIPRATSDSNGTTNSPSTEVKKDTMPNKFLSAEAKSKRYELAKEITTPDGFINTDGKPITVNGLIGKKVILIDFWTYSCINCQRTTPYLNAWYEKYKDKGLVIIGVHTPEFEFEKNYNNVKTAVEKFGIKFPVVLDNDFSTWNAYKNRYWPRKYLIDIDGYIVYDHIGEGAYDETERKIQELLEERAVVLGIQENVPKKITQSATNGEPDNSKPKSPEIYFGAARNLYLGNGKSETLGAQSLKEPSGIKTNILYLSGDWEFQNEFAENTSKEAKIIFRYQAKDVYIVASSQKGVKVRVLLDGKPLGKEAGEDVTQSTLFIKEDRLYKIIQNPGGWGEYTLELIIETSDLRAFTFTFG